MTISYFKKPPVANDVFVKLAAASNTADPGNFAAAESRFALLTEEANEMRGASTATAEAASGGRADDYKRNDAGGWLDSIVGGLWVADLLLIAGLAPLPCTLWHCCWRTAHYGGTLRRKRRMAVAASALSMVAYLVVWRYSSSVDTHWESGAVAFAIFAASILWGWSSCYWLLTTADGAAAMTTTEEVGEEEEDDGTVLLQGHEDEEGLAIV